MAITETLALSIVAEGFSSFMRQMDTMDRAIGNNASSWLSLNGILSGSIAVTLGNLASNLITAVTDALLDLARAGIEAFTNSIELAKDFESQMAILGIVSRNSGTGLEELRDVALKAGADVDLLGVNSQSASEAMSTLYKAGLTTTEIFGDLNGYLNDTVELGGALRAAIDLAAASELSLAETSDIAAIALSTFGREIENEEERAMFVTDAMNALVQSADASVSSVGDLAASLGYVGPTASAVGLTFLETTTALASLSNAGIVGSRAGTALESALRSLGDPTKEAQDLMRELNITMFDAEGATLPVVDIIGQLETAMAGMTEKQKAATLSTLFTARGQRAMAVLIEEGVEGWEDLTEQIGNAATISDIAAARVDTLAGRQEALKGATDAVRIGIGSAFLPMLTELTLAFATIAEEKGPEVVAFFEGLAKAVQPVIDWFLALITEGSVMNSAFEGLPAPLQNFLLTLQSLAQEYGPPVIEFLENLRAILKPLGSYFLMAITEGDFLNDWLTHLPEPIQDLIKTLVGFGSQIGGAFSQNFPTILSTLSNFWGVAQEIFGALVEWFQTYGPSILETFLTIWQEGWGLIQGIVQAFSDFWTEHGESIIAIAGEIGTFLAETVLPLLADAWATISEILQITFNALMEIAGKVVTWFEENWDNISTAGQAVADFWSNSILPALVEVWDLIVGAVQSAIDIILGVIQFFFAVINADWQGAWDAIVDILRGAWELIIGVLDGFLEFVLAIFGTSVAEFQTIWQTNWDLLGELIRKLWGNFVEWFEGVLEDTLVFWTGIWEQLSPIFEGIWNGFMDFFAGVWETFTGLFEDVFIGAKGVIDDLTASFDAVQIAIQKAWEWLVDFVTELANAVIPDWMKPGSPPPLYYALMDIGTAMKELSQKDLPEFQAALNLPNALNMVTDGFAPLLDMSLGTGNTTGPQIFNQYEYNLTTQSLVQPGALALEFRSMEASTR